MSNFPDCLPEEMGFVMFTREVLGLGLGQKEMVLCEVIHFREHVGRGCIDSNKKLANYVDSSDGALREMLSRLRKKGVVISQIVDGRRELRVSYSLKVARSKALSDESGALSDESGTLSDESDAPILHKEEKEEKEEVLGSSDSGEDSEESPSASSSSPRKKAGSSRARKSKVAESPSEEDLSSPDELDDSSYVGTSNSSGTRKKSQKRKTPSEKRSVASPPVEKKTRAAGERHLAGMKDTPKDEYPNTPAGKLAKKVEDHAAKIRGASRSFGKSPRASARYMEDCIEQIGIDQLRILVDAWVSHPNPREKYLPKPSSAKKFQEKLPQLIDWYPKYANQTLEEAAAAAKPKPKKPSKFDGMDPDLERRTVLEIHWNAEEGHRWRWWKFTKDEIKEIKSRGIEERHVSDDELQAAIDCYGFDPSEEGVE